MLTREQAFARAFAFGLWPFPTRAQLKIVNYRARTSKRAIKRLMKKAD